MTKSASSVYFCLLAKMNEPNLRLPAGSPSVWGLVKGCFGKKVEEKNGRGRSGRGRGGKWRDWRKREKDERWRVRGWVGYITLLKAPQISDWADHAMLNSKRAHALNTCSVFDLKLVLADSLTHQTTSGRVRFEFGRLYALFSVSASRTIDRFGSFRLGSV